MIEHVAGSVACGVAGAMIGVTAVRFFDAGVALLERVRRRSPIDQLAAEGAKILRARRLPDGLWVVGLMERTETGVLQEVCGDARYRPACVRVTEPDDDGMRRNADYFSFSFANPHTIEAFIVRGGTADGRGFERVVPATHPRGWGAGAIAVCDSVGVGTEPGGLGVGYWENGVVNPRELAA